MNFKQDILDSNKRYKESFVFGLSIACPAECNLKECCIPPEWRMASLKKRFKFIEELDTPKLDSIINKHFNCSKKEK